MKANEFIENKSDIKDIMNEELYMPYEYKMLKTNMIISQACHDTDGKIKISRANVSLLFRRMIVESYTSIEFDNDGQEFFNEYNLLEKNGVVDKIIEAIPEKEYETLDEMVWDAFGDMIDTEKCRDKFSEAIGLISSVLENLPLENLLAEVGEA